MTEYGARPAERWGDPDFARRWARNDTLADLLALPRSIAAATVGLNAPDVSLVVDIASGPGDFLAVMLEKFPSARGLWTDISRTMRDLARDRLAPYAGRVDFILADMTDLRDVAADADVITTSRASHHLDADGLLAFYAQAAARLAPGGWLINLDHVGSHGAWEARMRAVREFYRPAPREQTGHRHEHPLPSVDDHFGAFAAAGITDTEMIWRAFSTCLFMGQVGESRGQAGG
jgi:trans-aconitate methyltransferase